MLFFNNLLYTSHKNVLFLLEVHFFSFKLFTMRLFLIVQIIFLLALSACKKETPNFTIKGVIEDNSFDKGLNNATLELYEIEVGSKQSTFVSSTKTDVNGNYSFNFPRNKIEKYLITISKENYFTTEHEINFSSLTTNNDNIKNYVSNAKSWVNIHFNNIDNDQLKTLEYGIEEGKTDCDECCSSTRKVLTQITDTNVICINNGNSNYSIITISDTIKTFTINTVPFDTVELEIQF